MQNTKENTNENTKLEKKILIYLIIITLLLILYSLFFIHYIVDRGMINASQNATIVYPDDNDNNNNNNDNNDNNNGNNGNKDTDNKGTNDNSNKDNDSPKDNSGKKDDEEPIIDNDARIKFIEGSTEWNQLLELNIFKGSFRHVVDGKIAPGVQDTYAYSVECYGKNAMRYGITFSEQNPYNINMLYRLKYNGNYIIGNESTWVKASDLSKYGYVINPNTIDVFALEWKWADSENDTEIGRTDGANYKLIVNATAETITE